MPAKTPIYLKTSGRGGFGNKGSKKLLSADMISPPLGDFRHTAHVGRGGDDIFGDTSFLQKGTGTVMGTGMDTNLDWNCTKDENVIATGTGTGTTSMGSTKKGKDSTSIEGKLLPIPHQRSSTLGRGWTGKAAQFHKTETEKSSSADPSPILQSAFSLPLLSSDKLPYSQNSLHEVSSLSSEPHVEAKPEKHKLYSKSEEDVCLSEVSWPVIGLNGFAEGPPKPVRVVVAASQEEDKVEDAKADYPDRATNAPLSFSSEQPNQATNTTERQEEDAWKFDLDLGPSLMEEMMGIMERSRKQS